MPQPSGFFRSCSQSSHRASGIFERTRNERNTGSIGMVRAHASTRDRPPARRSLYRSHALPHVYFARQLESILERQTDKRNQDTGGILAPLARRHVIVESQRG